MICLPHRAESIFLDSLNKGEGRIIDFITIVRLKFKIRFNPLIFLMFVYLTSLLPLSEGERLWNQENQGITEILDILVGQQ